MNNKMEKSRTKNAEKNVVTAIFLQLLKIVLAFVNRIIFVRIMGASMLGINGLFSNVLSVLSLADLGMYTVMMYSLYQPLAKRDSEKIAAYVRLFNKIYTIIAIIVGIAGIAIIPFLKNIINLPQDIQDIYIYYLLMLANVIIGYLFIYRTTLLQADQKSYVLDRVDMVMQVILFVFQITILMIAKSYIFYLVASVLSTFVGNLLKSHFVSRYYGSIIKKRARLDKTERRQLLNNIKSMFLYKIGSVIQSNTDNILISIFVGTIAVGYYSNYTMVILAVTSFVSMIFNAIKASLGNFVAEKNRKEQEKMFYIFEDYSFVLVGFCSVCFYVLLPSFIKICFGEEYLLDELTLLFIVLNFYTSNIRQNIWMYRETTGIFSRVRYTTLVTSALNVILSLVGGKLFGITGIIAATVVSRLLYNWWKEPKVLFGEYFGSNAKKYLLTYILRLMYVCVAIFGLSHILRLVVVENDVLEFCIKTAITVLMSSAAIILPIIKNDSIIYAKKKLIARR